MAGNKGSIWQMLWEVVRLKAVLQNLAAFDTEDTEAQRTQRESGRNTFLCDLCVSVGSVLEAV